MHDRLHGGHTQHARTHGSRHTRHHKAQHKAHPAYTTCLGTPHGLMRQAVIAVAAAPLLLSDHVVVSTRLLQHLSVPSVTAVEQQ